MSEETKALTPQQSFEEKVKNRLRENIGDLMPDEVLAEMVKKAMNEMFFTRRERRVENSWSSKTEVFPSWFEDEVEARLKQKILDEISAAVAAKQSELHEVATKLIIEKMPQILVNSLYTIISKIAAGNSWDMQAQVTEMLRQKGFNV